MFLQLWFGVIDVVLPVFNASWRYPPVVTYLIVQAIGNLLNKKWQCPLISNVGCQGLRLHQFGWVRNGSFQVAWPYISKFGSRSASIFDLIRSIILEISVISHHLPFFLNAKLLRGMRVHIYFHCLPAAGLMLLTIPVHLLADNLTECSCLHCTCIPRLITFYFYWCRTDNELIC